MKRAVVISFNWNTGETMHTAFKGEASADDAFGMAHKDSFLWKDFPEADGWTHFFHATPEAMEVRGDRLAQEIVSNGTTTERIWK